MSEAPPADDLDGYTLDQVNEAERRIRAACPKAHFARTDYDWALAVANPDKTVAFIVFRPGRQNARGRVIQHTIIGNVDAIIARLRLYE